MSKKNFVALTDFSIIGNSVLGLLAREGDMTKWQAGPKDEIENPVQAQTLIYKDLADPFVRACARRGRKWR